MVEAGVWPRRDAAHANASGLLLLQAAAARAEIGPFARQAIATPQSAAGCYRAAAQLVPRARTPRPRLRPRG